MLDGAMAENIASPEDTHSAGMIANCPGMPAEVFFKTGERTAQTLPAAP